MKRCDLEITKLTRLHAAKMAEVEALIKDDPNWASDRVLKTNKAKSQRRMIDEKIEEMLVLSRQLRAAKYR